jgi:hypothetical protein
MLDVAAGNAIEHAVRNGVGAVVFTSGKKRLVVYALGLFLPGLAEGGI